MELISTFHASKKVEEVAEAKPVDKKRKKIQKHKTNQNQNSKEVKIEEDIDDIEQAFEQLFQGKIRFEDIAEQDRYLVDSRIDVILDGYTKSFKESVLELKRWSTTSLKSWTHSG